MFFFANAFVAILLVYLYKTNKTIEKEKPNSEILNLQMKTRENLHPESEDVTFQNQM